VAVLSGEGPGGGPFAGPPLVFPSWARVGAVAASNTIRFSAGRINLFMIVLLLRGFGKPARKTLSPLQRARILRKNDFRSLLV
jgi:hypothetical protein